MPGPTTPTPCPLAPDVRLQPGRHGARSASSSSTSSTCAGTPRGRSPWPWQAPDGGTHLFTGDSLFPGGVGNTKNPGQSFDSLYADVVERVFGVYDDDTWFYPGHGDDGRLADERPHLDEWRGPRLVTRRVVIAAPAPLA